jgi:hypothetical protein
MEYPENARRSIIFDNDENYIASRNSTSSNERNWAYQS